MQSTKTQPIQGGEFLIRDTHFSDIFIPEEFTEEQLMIAQSVHDFVETRIETNIQQLDNHHDRELLSKLMKEAGDLGLLGVSVPEEYEGFGQNFVTSMLSTEAMGGGHSFSVAYTAHTGIGTLPILYFGTATQKKQYLPGLATGEILSAYCLTEPGAGSDANSGKTKAVLNSEGTHYLINGQKMWITNGGVADLFIVFAKIDDDEDLSAFIVEKKFGNITINPDEEKMGIQGSSTTQVFFNDTPVPIDNLLGKRGFGFKIALYVLNTGRIKLAAATLGASKKIIDRTIQYANERKQFGRPISKYGAIRFKLAEQAIQTWVTESAAYRAAQNIEDVIQGLIENGTEYGTATIEGIRAFAIEDAILKVLGSETLDYVVDEGVQVFGGMGYSAEAPMERAYRDSRINRIFEGTNEINRMLIVDMMLRKALKGELDLMTPATAVANELLEIPDFEEPSDALFHAQTKMLVNFKKAILMVAGAAVQKLMMSLAKEQEILTNIADMAIQVYAAESALLRAQKIASLKGEAACELQAAMVSTYIYDASDKILKAGKDAINSFAEGDEWQAMMMGLRRFTKHGAFNPKLSRQLIAQKLIEENKYCL
jgi:alkylation response protein AidB-like acyl-CoA dehydrogenase